LIEFNPVGGVGKPGKSRGEEFYTREEYDRIPAAFPDQSYLDLVTTAWETGCRPRELFKVGAYNLDAAGKRWVFKIMDSEGK
jgi:hypothetical protein